MIDLDTFLTTLYVMGDDCCQSEREPERLTPGPQAAVSRREIVTLAMFGQWVQFPRERAYYRYAEHHLRKAFPSFPDRRQFNRQQREYQDVILIVSQFLVQNMHARNCAYEVIDSTAAVTRDSKRRGTGWLAGQADIGWSNRVGWYEGFHVVLRVTAMGVITGFGFGSASTHDQHLAATLFAIRQSPAPQLPSVGLPAQGSYIAEKGFAGEKPRQRYLEQFEVDVVSPPHQKYKRVHWPKALRRWLASHREIIETVNDKLLHTFRLARERPHVLAGFQARLAAKVSLPNFCI